MTEQKQRAYENYEQECDERGLTSVSFEEWEKYYDRGKQNDLFPDPEPPEPDMDTREAEARFREKQWGIYR